MTASSQTPTGAPPPEPLHPLAAVPLPEAFRATAATMPPPPAVPAPPPAVVAPVSPDVPDRLRARAPEPDGPECFTCGTNQSLLYPDPRGRRYDSGAQVLYCGTHVPDATPVQAAAKVMGAAMENGSATPRELAQAEEDAGILFDPQRAQDIADSARAQARTEYEAKLASLQQDVATLSHFKDQIVGIRRLLSGRPDNDLMFVREILAAADPKTPFGIPLPVTWDGIVMGPSGDTEDERTLVPLTTSHGGQAALVLDSEQRLTLGGLLLTHAHTSCPTPGCGIEAVTVDESDPALWGWVLVQVAGTDTPARWYCNPWCASGAITAAGAELTAADQAAAVDPDEQAPASAAPVAEAGPQATADAFDDEPRCVRCGCTGSRACPGGCHWVANRRNVHLCSACALPTELAVSGGAL
ncbi:MULTISPECIES: hypothetical protein [unclassified Streptomyces]|uniref:hypothetical protein n=1 Tax=unclassified Streptomyces TaxID=2593676 RepID=UPI001CD29815|nr:MULTISPECIES: hypothetical protein [unclassified Streptomyces]